jgi:hypothetical protein
MLPQQQQGVSNSSRGLDVSMNRPLSPGFGLGNGNPSNCLLGVTAEISGNGAFARLSSLPSP